MTATGTMRGVLLLKGDAAAAAAARRAARDVRWEVRDLAGVVAGGDAGAALADRDVGGARQVYVVADADGVAALRRHDRTALAPVLGVGASARALPGADGAVDDWEDGVSARVRALLRRLADLDLPPSAEVLDSRRTAHRFARFLMSRGRASAADAAAFGVEAPRSLLQAWTRSGWVEADADGVRAMPALAAVARADTLPQAPADPLAQAPANGDAPAPVPHAPASPSPPTATERTPSARRAVARLALGLVVVLLAFVGLETLSELGGAAPTEAGDVEPPAEDPAAARDASAPAADAARWRASAVGARLVLRAPASGRIASLAVDAGREVARGDVLMRLDGGEAAERLAAAEDRLRALEDSLAAADAAAAEADLRRRLRAEEALEAAHAAEERWRARIPERVARYERARALAEDGVLAWREVRPDWESLEEARDALAAAERERRAAERALEEAGDSASWPPSQTPEWRLLREQRQAERDRWREAVAERSLRAPAEGVVAEWSVAPGEEVEAGAPAGTFVTTRAAGISLRVDAAAWPEEWSPGADARVRRAGMRGQPVRAPVEEVRVDGEGTLAVRLGWPPAWREEGRRGERVWVVPPGDWPR